MDGLVLMGESLCRADPEISLHLTVPEASAAVRRWAEHRPQVILSTQPLEGVRGWDVKARLLLQELKQGRPEALWLDADMIVTRPISRFLREFPRDSLIVAEEWNRPRPVRVTDLWEMPSARAVIPVNSCFLRAAPAHRPLLERWIEMTRVPRYREAQALPFEERPWHLASDQALLTALLGSQEFGQVAFDYIRMGRHIAQCAGSSGYRPGDRMLDLFRGLPPLIHCIGRKPWEPALRQGPAQAFLLDLATDLSPYVLASRRVAGELGLTLDWVNARTAPGRMLRRLAGSHPGMSGLPLAIIHASIRKTSQMIRGRQGKVGD